MCPKADSISYAGGCIFNTAVIAKTRSNTQTNSVPHGPSGEGVE